MTDAPTELDLVVGFMIKIRPDEDRDAFEEEQEIVALVQDKLREEGIVVDLLSQPGTELWEGGIKSFGVLYQLTRIAIYLERGSSIASILDDGPVLYDEFDPVVMQVWDSEAETKYAHLVHLQDINSYYLPIDFEQPLWLVFENDDSEEEEAFFGSSVRLQRELTELEGLMRQANVPSGSAVYECLNTLREAANQSLHHNLPIIVW